jgi:hypothetical protein
MGIKEISKRLEIGVGSVYAALCQSSPDVVKRLHQGDIACFLGITPTAFSRIKRCIASQR